MGTRIVRFSVQGNHIHLIVEAAASPALSRAMQGFSIRVAKGLNGMMHRSGQPLSRAFVDAYSSEGAPIPLTLPRTWLLRAHPPPD